MKQDISGKIALVSGAGSGLGKEIAIRLSSLGVKVLLCGRNMEHLKEVQNEWSSKVYCNNNMIFVFFSYFKIKINYIFE